MFGRYSCDHQEKQTPGTSVADRTEDSPGPAPAPEPELLPSDLSSDWPTGRDGKHENTGDGRKDGGGGSNNHNHTQGYSCAQKLRSGVDLRTSHKHKCVSEQNRQPL